MTHVNLTIVPDALGDDFGPEFPEQLSPEGPLSTWDEPQLAATIGPARTPAEAVDWFMEEGDSFDDDDGMPRLPVARTDETDVGPPSVSLEEDVGPAPVRVKGSPRRGFAIAGLVATGVMGVGLGALVTTLGAGAMAAGAATVWLVSEPAQAGPGYDAAAALPAVEAVTATPPDEAAEPAAAPEEVEEPDDAPVPKAPAVKAPAPVATPPAVAPVAPVEADAPRASRPPIVRPKTGGEADPVPRTVKVITSPPAARLLIDGVDHGRTPQKLDLPAGQHSVVLEQGGVRSTLDITVDAGTDPSRLCFTASEGVYAPGGCP